MHSSAITTSASTSSNASTSSSSSTSIAADGTANNVDEGNRISAASGEASGTIAVEVLVSNANAINGHEANKQHNGFNNSLVRNDSGCGEGTNNHENTLNVSVDSVSINVEIGDGDGDDDVEEVDGDGEGNGIIDDSNSVITKNPTLNLDKTNQEIIRLIGQYLQDIGLDKSAKTLMNESGCYLEHPAATKFRQHVLSGEWNKADADLKDLERLITNSKPSTITEMKFILLEQKYLEFLDEGCPLDALHVLRNELTPLQHNISRVHQLSSYMMCSNNQDLYQRAKWEGKGILTRAFVMERLQAFLPPSVMMPPRRLRGLLQQAVEQQTHLCPCHDMAWETNIQNVSLLTDHSCATEGFPMQTIQILSDHCDEVWFCKFSPDGLKLATGSKDATIIIWDVDTFKLTLKLRHILDGQSQLSVAFISWSPDSKLLLVGGPDNSNEISLWSVDDGKCLVRMSHSSDDSLSCGAFNRDGTRFVCGGQKGQFYLCDLNGTIMDSWEGVRINSVAFRSDNKTILAGDNHYRIRGYQFDNPRTDFDVIKEPHPIMTFSLNSSDRLALLNISNQGLHLWDLEEKCLLRRFQGIRQKDFAIHSCFGGVNESFVASGSEDKMVCIWHIKREEPLTKLAGHSKTVNCVSWNPVFPSLLASASDDSTVRIWGPKSHPANATPDDECSSCSSSSSWNMTS